MSTRAASIFTVFMSSITHGLDWCACQILGKVTLLQSFSRPSNILRMPFVKCCLPFIIKGSSYSWLLPKADFNFIVQTNRETVCSATPKPIHGRAESNLQDTWYNCHLPALTNNVQQFYLFIYFFFYFFFGIVFSFLTSCLLWWFLLFFVLYTVYNTELLHVILMCGCPDGHVNALCLYELLTLLVFTITALI